MRMKHAVKNKKKHRSGKSKETAQEEQIGTQEPTHTFAFKLKQHGRQCGMDDGVCNAKSSK